MVEQDDRERYPSRKNPRLKQHDYALPNYYFVTICSWNKVCCFGRPGDLNRYGKIAEQGLLEIETHFSNVKVDKFVVMPNHVHAIIVLQGNDTDLSTVIGQYKSFVSRQIHVTEPGQRVWQTSYHDHVIRDQKGYERIWLYIDSNPANWEKDCFFAV
ncbi:MAG: transposase [Faecousia sp.]